MWIRIISLNINANQIDFDVYANERIGLKMTIVIDIWWGHMLEFVNAFKHDIRIRQGGQWPIQKKSIYFSKHTKLTQQ